MLGNINEDTLLRDYYSVADAFVMPSREDNLPNVIVEAMACGTPVLSFNVGGMAEIIRDGFNGLKAYKTEPKALSNIMNKFIETKKEYSSRLIRNYALENFSNSIVAEKYKQVYQSALKK
jgi:glycosyltransferase involved in cell wall biosynthesis